MLIADAELRLSGAPGGFSSSADSCLMVSKYEVVDLEILGLSLGCEILKSMVDYCLVIPGTYWDK